MLYLKMDVLELTDVFENFVEKATLEYSINPLYSYSIPGYTWKAGLKITKIKSDFVKDKEKMGPRYIEADEKTKLLYIDANTLYGWAMSQYLPTGDFKKIKFLKMMIRYSVMNYLMKSMKTF